jgi:hypothetical protein
MNTGVEGCAGPVSRMILKVQIAPLDQWCDLANRKTLGYPIDLLPGFYVDIFTETLNGLSSHCCDGRTWRLSKESAVALDALI